MKQNPYLAVEGPIGVGKTTLAQRLAASLDLRMLAEAPQENPFLADFYAAPRARALAAQLYFLLQRARQVDTLGLTEPPARGVITDFMFAKDRLFARLTLSAAELELYDAIRARVGVAAPAPDCVIYLDADVDTLMARIRCRDRAAERPIRRGYLAAVAAAYRAFFAAYQPGRLIRLDARVNDLVASDSDYAALLARVREML